MLPENQQYSRSTIPRQHGSVIYFIGWRMRLLDSAVHYLEREEEGARGAGPNAGTSSFQVSSRGANLSPHAGPLLVEV